MPIADPGSFTEVSYVQYHRFGARTACRVPVCPFPANWLRLLPRGLHRVGMAWRLPGPGLTAVAFRFHKGGFGAPRRPTPRKPVCQDTSSAEYRARIAKAALSGFRQGDDLVSIGLEGVRGDTPARRGQD